MSAVIPSILFIPILGAWNSARFAVDTQYTE